MTLKPAWQTRAHGAPSASVRTQISGCAWQHRAGTKSRALVRVRQAESIGQHYRDANQQDRRKPPTLLVVKSTLERKRVKLRGAKCHESEATEEK